jgi:intracellular septation protein
MLMVFRYDTRMTTLLELAPLAAFFIAYQLKGLYVATAVLMVASLVLLFAHRALHGNYKNVHVVTAVLVLVLGSATLLLHDKRFIQWKPTVLFGLFAAALLISGLVGQRPLIQRMFTAMVPEGITLSARGWHGLNLLWAAWFALVAAANLYVARVYSEQVWVNFHTYGVSLATLVFMLPQVFWLASKTSSADAGQSDGTP